MEQYFAMNRTIGTATVILIITLFVSAGTLLSLDVVSLSSESNSLTIQVDQSEGTNVYTMNEIDEGDNDEEVSVIYVYHEFVFTATGGGDTIRKCVQTWFVFKQMDQCGLHAVTWIALVLCSIRRSYDSIYVPRDWFTHDNNSVIFHGLGYHLCSRWLCVCHRRIPEIYREFKFLHPWKLSSSYMWV